MHRLRRRREQRLRARCSAPPPRALRRAGARSRRTARCRSRRCSRRAPRAARDRRVVGRAETRSPKNTRWPAIGTPSRMPLAKRARRLRAAARANRDRPRPARPWRRAPSSIVGGQREDRHAVERAAGRHDARGRNQPEARLQADDVVEPRGHAAGARRIGAERKRHEAGRHRRPPSPSSSRPGSAPDRWRCAARHRASARRRGRSRTDRGWSCR